MTHPPAPAHDPEKPDTLRRVLSTRDAIALSAGIMIGSGIFAVPPVIAGHLDTFGSMISIWLLGGLLALCGALTYAELSSMFPRTGGTYVFLHETYGPLLAFGYGWSALLITYPASMAAVAVVFAHYLDGWVPLSGIEQSIVAVSLCLLVAVINILGVRFGAGIQRGLTAAKVIALAAIPVFGFLLRRGDAGHLSGGFMPVEGFALSAWALSLAAVMWTFEGWSDTPTIAGEVKNARRNVPRGLILSVVMVTAVYLAVNVAYVYLLSIPGVKGTDSVASESAVMVFGSAGEFWITALVLVSTAGSLNGMVISGSRVMYAMARDGLFLDRVGRVHPRFGTPAVSLAVLGILGAAYSLWGTFDEIIRYFVFVATLWFALNTLAVFVLRRKRPTHPRPFRVPLYPATPLLFLLVVGGLSVQLFRDNLLDSSMGILILILAVPAFMLWRRLH